jgi:hypothetical protein
METTTGGKNLGTGGKETGKGCKEIWPGPRNHVQEAGNGYRRQRNRLSCSAQKGCKRTHSYCVDQRWGSEGARATACAATGRSARQSWGFAKWPHSLLAEPNTGEKITYVFPQLKYADTVTKIDCFQREKYPLISLLLYFPPSTLSVKVEQQLHGLRKAQGKKFHIIFPQLDFCTNFKLYLGSGEKI